MDRAALLRIAVGVACHLLTPAGAAPATGRTAQMTEHQADLQALRQKMLQLQRDVASGESSRAEVADQLRETERTISALQRELHNLGEQRRERLAARDALNLQAGSLSEELSGHRQRLEQSVVRRYLQGAPDPVRLLLAGRNSAQTSRDLVYLSAIANARQALVRQTRSTLATKQQLAEESQREAEALATIEARQRDQQAALEQRRAERQTLLAGLSSRIVRQHKEIGALRRDEQRLTRVIDRLTRLLADEARARKKRLAAQAAPRPPRPGRADARRADRPGSTGTPQLVSDGNGLREGLAQPVRGTLVQRFGSPQDGGGRWKGLVFRTAPGAEIRAAAAGQVVFADWLRGFGNLLIVDHGSGYLTIYGYNEALLREVGERVAAGSTIATAGNSGGREETGLYFELRHEGTAVDPERWLRLR